MCLGFNPMNSSDRKRSGYPKRKKPPPGWNRFSWLQVCHPWWFSAPSRRHRFGVVGALLLHRLVDVTQAEAMICQSTQESIPQGIFASCGNHLKKMTKTHMQRFLKSNLATRAEEVIAGPRERTAASVFNHLESVALAIEGSDLNIIGDNFVRTARCSQDTKERHLVTRFGLQRLRCCVCHLHHEPAMSAPASGRQLFKTILQCRCHCWRCQRGQHTSTTKSKSTKI